MKEGVSIGADMSEMAVLEGEEAQSSAVDATLEEIKKLHQLDKELSKVQSQGKKKNEINEK